MPFILHSLEKFIAVLTDKIERKILTITLGKTTNIQLFCSTKINRKKNPLT